MEELVRAISDLDEDSAFKIVKEKLQAGEDPLQIVELCRKGLEIAGHATRRKSTI